MSPPKPIGHQAAPRPAPGRQPSPERKARILDAARVLFWQKGYQGCSMRDLAQASGCRAANLYNYFESKDEVLFEVLREEMEQILGPVRHLEHDQEAPPLEQLRFFVRNHIQLTLGPRRAGKLLFDMDLGHLSPPRRRVILGLRRLYDRILVGILERGVARGDLAPANLKLAAYGIASLIARSRVWYSPQGPLSPEQIGDFFCQMVLEGLKPRPDTAALDPNLS